METDSSSAESESEVASTPRLEVDSASRGEAPTQTSTEPAWYVIHCYSGYENKVRHNLEQRIETMGMKDKIFDVVIPTQDEVEVRDGKRRTVERHIFPGYVLVNLNSLGRIVVCGAEYSGRYRLCGYGKPAHRFAA